MSSFSEAPGTLAKRSSTSATSQVVGKCMGRHLTCELTFDGILVNGHLFAHGRIVASVSHAVMSYNDTREHTLVSARSNKCYV